MATTWNQPPGNRNYIILADPKPLNCSIKSHPMFYPTYEDIYWRRSREYPASLINLCRRKCSELSLPMVTWNAVDGRQPSMMSYLFNNLTSTGPKLLEIFRVGCRAKLEGNPLTTSRVYHPNPVSCLFWELLAGTILPEHALRQSRHPKYKDGKSSALSTSTDTDPAKIINSNTRQIWKAPGNERVIFGALNLALWGCQGNESLSVCMVNSAVPWYFLCPVAQDWMCRNADFSCVVALAEKAGKILIDLQCGPDLV